MAISNGASKYDPKNIEEKWKKRWEESGIYKDYGREKKFYALDMFPYPSGEGLHVGHPKGYIATDVVSRLKLLQGYSVLHPMGWDAFGLPAENYALKNKVHPRIAVEKNIATFKKQLKLFGFTYDWDREINTTDPDYYKWTQWIFLKMFEKGLAYESEEPVNWCPKCKTVLANEDLEGGKCERCNSGIIQRKIRQWVLKMTEYADRLLYDLESEDLDWEELIKEQQRNWIGRSEGVIVKFKVQNSKFKATVKNSKLENDDEYIETYTTRLDTIFGCTYCVVAPEHPIVQKLKDKIENYSEVEKYVIKSQSKTELERMELQKEKTGVKLRGIKVINPFNGKEIPLFVADYVLGFYGTGAVMAVPAHDERDFEFAKKYGLPIVQSITPSMDDYEQSLKVLEVLKKIHEGAKKRDLQFWLSSGLACMFYAKIIYRKIGDIDIVVKNKEEQAKFAKYLEEMGFKKIKEKVFSEKYVNFIFQDKNKIEVDLGVYLEGLELGERGFRQREKELNGCKTFVLSKHFNEELKESLSHDKSNGRDKSKDIADLKYLEGRAYAEDGYLVNSEKYSGLSSEKARKKMALWLEKEKIGKKKVNYKMRDWVFSRQRYWGEPVPIIHCKKCGTVPVPEKDLPVILPEVKSYEPTDTGESPLAKISNWVNVSCPKCSGPGKRETNTMPQWAGSCWYYLRYIDPQNDEVLIDKQKEKKWMPVDLYVGGAEHATRHLLYARFWHKFLYDIGAVSTEEPFKKLVHVGLIQAEDGRKMSKRWGNVINPDDVISKFGADAMRVYEMFMGPFAQNIAWSTNGVIGAYRFLEKTYKLADKVQTGSELKANKKTEILINKTIKKVGEDIENFRFNTAVSQLMILVNELDKEESIPIANYQSLITLLSPFAPFIAEELWEKLGHKESIFKEKWPEYDPKMIKDEEIELVIQVNGKVRDKMKASADLSEEEGKKLALESEKIKNIIGDKEIKKFIYVEGRLVNIVI